VLGDRLPSRLAEYALDRLVGAAIGHARRAEAYEALRAGRPPIRRPVTANERIEMAEHVEAQIARRFQDLTDPAGHLAAWLEPGTTKNREGRMFVMTPELRATLEVQRVATEIVQRKRGLILPWVFHRRGKPIAGFRKAWAKACKHSGCPGRITHDFRRTAVRNLERAGVPRSVAMKMVGHKTEAICRRYAIVDEAMLREGAERLARAGASLETAGVIR
jgi:Phage integrase family